MPIVNCHTKVEISQKKWEGFVELWAEMIKADTKDIVIHVISDYIQLGAKYTARIELFLPTAWAEKDIENIQKSFISLLASELGILESEVFLLTLLVESGHVIDGGKLERW